jgi:hypothetical protein
MLFVRVKLPTLWRFLAVALLGILAGYALRGVADSTASKPADTVPALVAHLEKHGIQLRVIPTARDGDICEGAFLTRSSKDWEQLSVPFRIPEQLPRWQGTVQVQPVSNTLYRTEARLSWGKGGLVYGQLVLFGDPALLAEVRAAVGE